MAKPMKTIPPIIVTALTDIQAETSDPAITAIVVQVKCPIIDPIS